jgi:hypothetical protein
MAGLFWPVLFNQKKKECMADEIEQTADREESLLEARIASVRTEAKKHMPFTGRCYNCGEPLGNGIYCDGYCRDDYQARLAARLRNQGVKPD